MKPWHWRYWYRHTDSMWLFRQIRLIGNTATLNKSRSVSGSFDPTTCILAFKLEKEEFDQKLIITANTVHTTGVYYQIKTNFTSLF